MPQDNLLLQIQALSDKGEALAEAQGMLYFIDGPLPGERVRAEPGDPFVEGSRRAPARLLEIVEPQPERVEPFCPHFGLCGGCALQQASLKLQHELKQKAIAKALAEAGVVDFPQSPIYFVPADPAYPDLKLCRFKSIRRFELQLGRIVSGFYQKRSHAVQAVYDCPLEPSWMGAVAADLCVSAQHARLLPYSEEIKSGMLRYLLMREGNLGQRLMLLVTAEPLPEFFYPALEELCSLHAVSSCYIGVNDAEGNQVLPESVELVFGKENIVKSFGGLSFEVGPLSFMQVNYPVTEALYKKAVEHCGSGARALDLCCGAGTMSLQLAKSFDSVVGVEIVPSAIEAARRNAERNEISNAEFHCADMTAFLQQQDLAFDALIADPARAGLGARNCRVLGSLKGPLKAAFIFCSLKALKRDLKVLLEQGFVLDEVQGFDMFPHTMHVETLVLMHKD